MKAVQNISLVILLAVLLVCVWVVLIPQISRAASPWYVQTDGDDSNSCLSPGPTNACATIQAAVDKASGGDTIYIAEGSYTDTGDWVVSIGKDLTLSGGWNEGFSNRSGTTFINGEDMRRVIHIEVSASVDLEYITIINGAGQIFWSELGGGIYHEGSSLSLDNINVNGNHTHMFGGGIYHVGDSLTIFNSIIFNNSVNADGGGIYHGGTSLTIHNSIINANSADDGGGIYIASGASITVTESTILENSASWYGGGIYNEEGEIAISNTKLFNNSGASGAGINNNGGDIIISRSSIHENTQEAIRNNTGNFHINNSTISGNTGGAGAIVNLGNMTLHNSTVTDSDSGGLVNNSSGTLIIQNSIVAGNENGGTPEDCRGSSNIVSDGYNLLGNISNCSITLGPGDMTNTDPKLGPLFTFPGAQGYHPLLSTSPAIDAGDPDGCKDHLANALNTDQRGTSRVGRCDIGAIEYTNPGPAASIHVFSGTPQRTPPSFDFWMPLQAAVLDSNGSPVEGVSVIFSAPESGASGTFDDSDTITTTVVSANDGIVTASNFIANNISGSYNVEATVMGITTAANFQLNNIGWYVAPDGNNENHCQSVELACKDINAVLAKPEFYSGDTILVASGVYTQSGPSVEEIVLINQSARILGGWNKTFTSQTGYSLIDGSNAWVGIAINDYLTVEFEHFDIQNSGRGILNLGAILTINESNINNNSGEGIWNLGDLTISNTLISRNLGGGMINGYDWTSASAIINNSRIISNTVEQRGGGIFNNNSSIIMIDSEVSSNTAQQNDGGGILNQDGTLTITNSIISSNTARGGGGGIANVGGTTTLINSSVTNNLSEYGAGAGIHNSDNDNTQNFGYLTLTNSTVSGNSAESAGGGIYNGGSTTLNSSTVSHNKSTGYGGGIYNWSNFVMRNSIIASNSGTQGQDCSGEIYSVGYNLIGDTADCSITLNEGDLLDVKAMLFPLTGEPGYHPLAPCSPAIDAGDPTGCEDDYWNLLTTDQRGAPRPVDGNGDGESVCDIGAYEYDPSNEPGACVFSPIIISNYSSQ